MAGTLHSGIYSGMIVACCEPSAPNGWLFCDGSEVQISQYANLYNAITTVYNTGSETAGYFRLPNLIDTIPAGADPVAAGTRSGSNTHSHSTGVTIGVNAMSTNTDGSHTHGQFGTAYTGEGGDHGHTVDAATLSASGSNIANSKSTGGTLNRALNNHTHSLAARATSNSLNHWHNATPSGISGGGAHNHTALTITGSITGLSGNTASYAPSHQVKYIIKT